MVEQAISRTRTGIIQALSPKIILPALVLVTGVMYLSAAAGRAGLGFPLDDSWIHQTIARNIALHGEYTFNLHQPMSGSTAPLWTVLLAIGYFTPGGYLWFTYALGLVSLLLTALVVYELAATFYPAQKVLALVAAVFYVLEWRSGWSALSGMETPLFTLLCCLAFLLYARGQSRPARWIWPATGLAAAAATFLRPEGLGIFLVLIAHSLWQVWWQKRAVGQPAPLAPLIKRGGGQVPLISGIRGGYLYGESPTPPYQGGTLESPPDKGDLGGFVHRQGLTPPSHRRAHRHAALQGESTLAPGLVLAGFLILAGIGYAAFNYHMSGTIMPTTFYAKSQYYSPSLDLQVTLTYILMAPWTLFLGPLLALTPGIAFGLVMITRRIRRAATTRREAPVTVGQQITPRLDLILLPAVWMVAVFGLYAIRLPVAYQHGRYLMPLIPFLCIYGLHGTANMLSGLRKVKMSKAAAVWPILIAAAALLLWIRGAGIYGDEVKFIDDEHLTTAAWLRENTPSNAKVATHDIGAMGYFSGREIVDIAGLITPQAIAYTRDQSKLLEFVRSQGAEYLAIFPDWYPSLAKSMEPYLLHRVQADYVTDAGFQNMSIYRVPPALEGQ